MNRYPAANRARGGRIPVRGSCPDGHITETKSDPGRVTWSGECGAEGCAHRITARRIPGQTAPAAAAAEPPETPGVHHPPEPEPETVKEVDYGKRSAGPRGRRPDPVPGADPGSGTPPVVDVDERTPEPEFASGEPEPPRGTVDRGGAGLVDQRPPRRRRERDQTRHVFALPWE